jgi:MoaA/NifB/PqqE/SkfB family radical SAM enzyme
MSRLGLICTTRCNFDCLHCIRKGAAVSEIDLDLLGDVLRQARPLGFDAIHLSGGEPGLHPRFEELVEVMVEQGYRFSIGTNGSAIERYTFALAHGDLLTHISTSLDGGQATHDYLRQRGSYRRLMVFIDHYSAQGVPFRVVTTLNQFNLNELEAVIGTLISHGVGQMFVGSVIPTSYNAALRLDDEQRYALYQRYLQLREEYKDRISIQHTTSLHRGQNRVDFCKEFGFSKPAINARGELLFCCDTPGDGAALGSLRQHTFTELFSRGVDRAAALKKARIDDLAAGNIFAGFDSCQFCSHYLGGQTGH